MDTAPVISATPPAAPSRLRAWLELCRISNLPTVWTNVLTGSALAHMTERNYQGVQPPFDSPYVFIAAIAFSMSLFYVAGMALNDLMDAEVDAVERPGRPIPSGRVSKGAALYFIMFCFVAGLGLTWFLMPTSTPYVVLLIFTIVGYNYLHKRFASAALLMGASRALVVLAAGSLAFIETFEQTSMFIAAALALYVVGITVIARGEVEDRIDNRKWLAVAMPFVVLFMVAIVRPVDWRWAAIAAFIFSLWMSQAIRAVFERPPKTIKAVLTWLSGICLVDAYFLCLLGAPYLAAIAGACFLLTVLAHRKILGT